jgi:hypothetical protein
MSAYRGRQFAGSLGQPTRRLEAQDENTNTDNITANAINAFFII